MGGLGYTLTLARKKEKLPEICFTGFSATEKARLCEIAESAHMLVAHSVTVSLSYLCIGENVGPAKLAKAQDQGTIFLSAAQFERLLETGELAAS